MRSRKTSLSLLALTLAILMFSCSEVALASESNTYSTGATSGSVKVKASVAETYQVVLPVQISLSRNLETGVYEGTYTVSVKANLINGEKIVVVPQGDFKLSDGGSSYSDSTSVSQVKTTWTPVPSADNEIASSATEFVQTQGTVTASFSKAGDYEGDLNFTFTKINRE